MTSLLDLAERYLINGHFRINANVNNILLHCVFIEKKAGWRVKVRFTVNIETHWQPIMVLADPIGKHRLCAMHKQFTLINSHRTCKYNRLLNFDQVGGFNQVYYTYHHDLGNTTKIVSLFVPYGRIESTIHLLTFFYYCWCNKVALSMS